ncbi:MAG: hypothetical protein IPK59_23260 [Rhodospirillaceae bacterium]|nr:hypothetical protein [Rhodospirillaceae bacterium]
MLTKREREFIRHALGLSNPDSRGVAYRNYYYARRRRRCCHGLVAKGLAVHYPPVVSYQPDDAFMITTAGFEAAKNKAERLDREEAERIKKVDAKAAKAA